MIIIISVVILLLIKCDEIPDFSCDYVNVDSKNDANVFYWLYGSYQTIHRSSDPVVIWLQGGPGGSSLLGDLCEIGPYDFQCFKDEKIVPRQYPWNEFTNLIFIDQPVGTGFSYVKNKEGYVHNEEQISEELLIVIKNIFRKYPDFQQNDLWIFSESYGGKMNANFAVHLHNAIKRGEINATFKGVGLGDSWISPLDCVQSYGTFLKGISHFDQKENDKCDDYAQQIETALNNKQYEQATTLWSQQQDYIIQKTKLNFYNFLSHTDYDMDGLANYANTEMREKFGIIPNWLQWGQGGGIVFKDLEVDFMQDCIDKVDILLDEGYEVVVYSGQLDLIVDTLCTEGWMTKLKWKDIDTFLDTDKLLLRTHKEPDNVYFKKTYKNLSLFYISNAGHMVPMDNPSIAYGMLEGVVTNEY